MDDVANISEIDIKIDSNIKNCAKENHIKNDKSILIIQKFIRRYCVRKYVLKFRKSVYETIKSPDTVRITPGKFTLPLYVVQRTIFNKIFGKRLWDKFNHKLENSFLLTFMFGIFLFSNIISGLYLFNFYTNTSIYFLSILSCIPIYVVYFLLLQDKLTILVFSTLECKLYILLSLFSCIGLTVLFLDLRCLSVWVNMFIGTILLPLSDAIPRYLNKSRKLFILLYFTYVIYCLFLTFGIVFDYINITDYQFVIYSNNKKNVRFSSVTYTISNIQTLMVLILKNLTWYFYNSHRAIILKSPLLITNIRDWKKPVFKKNYRKKFYVEKKIHLSHDEHIPISKLNIKPSFMFCNSY